MKALGLEEKRRLTALEGLDKLIDRGFEVLMGNADVPFRVSNLVEALKAKAKITGEWVDRSMDVPAEFQGKTDAELEFFVANRRWPTKEELEALQGRDEVH